MKYIKFNKGKSVDLNIIFVFEDQLPLIKRALAKGRAYDDIEFAIKNHGKHFKFGFN